MKKKLKSIAMSSIFGLSLCLSFSAQAQTPPAHTPVAGYQYANGGAGLISGHAFYLPPNFEGARLDYPMDVAVTSNYHFQSGTAGYDELGTMFLMRKCAPDGGHNLSFKKINIGTYLNSITSFDVCNGMLLEEAYNRIYLFGSTQNPGESKKSVVLCYNLNTMAIETNFDQDGVQTMYFDSEVMDMAIMATGELVVLLNQKDDNGKNVFSLVGLNNGGGWLGYNIIEESGYEYYGKRIRKHGSKYYVAGKAVDPNNPDFPVPMMWEIQKTGVGPCVFAVSKETNPASPISYIGYGEFIDFGFLAKGTTGWHDIIAIGNDNGRFSNGIWVTSGIWAKFNLQSSTGFTLLSYSTFYNRQTTLAPIFERCLVQPNGFTVITATDNGGSSMLRGRIGYINIAGTAYTQTRILDRIQSASGLNKDASGNIIVGCSDYYNSGITTVKLKSYVGTWSEVVNKMQTSLSENEESMDLTIDVFPNPASNTLTLTSKGTTADNARIEVIDVAGKTVVEMNSSFSDSEQKTTIDITNLEKGIYLIRLTNNDKSTIKKFVKQ